MTFVTHNYKHYNVFRAEGTNLGLMDTSGPPIPAVSCRNSSRDHTRRTVLSWSSVSLNVVAS